MKIDAALQTQIETIFAPLNEGAAAHAFPALGALSEALTAHLSSLPKGSPSEITLDLPRRTASFFATAAVDAWLRGVHSFLISASLTDASPIWASVSGYYSSHYSVRAIAHLLGSFQLFSMKRVVRLDLKAGKHVCSFVKKQGNDREHKFYWKIVKGSSLFSGDMIFTDNSNPNSSEASHRDSARAIARC